MGATVLTDRSLEAMRCLQSGRSPYMELIRMIGGGWARHALAVLFLDLDDFKTVK